MLAKPTVNQRQLPTGQEILHMTDDLTRSAREHLQNTWSQAWTLFDTEPGGIFWNADLADLNADLDLIRPVFGRRLPVLDLGCGDGRQSRFLAEHFLTVIGADIAASAIDRARAPNNPANVRYLVLDVRDVAHAQRVHNDLGDVNVYLRGVLQALPAADRPAAAASIAALLGATGTLFAKELSAESATYFTSISQRHGRPAGLALVHQLGLTPGQISEDDIAELFPHKRFKVSIGQGYIRTTTRLPTGEPVAVPALSALVRPRIAGDHACSTSEHTGVNQ
jgi:2-polyprenyl-3-methyl-5-hydroxy-6-metoxy-1,4-benzoquinol methylase